jgi:hypothetical protein
MDIQSAFSAGMTGFRRASEGITEATVNINREAGNQQRMRDADQEMLADTDDKLQKQPAVPSQTDSLVQMTQNKLQAEANIRSVQTADEMMGTLIDLKV